MKDLVSYNKEGGGAPPTIRVKGIKQVIRTIKKEKTLEIEEFTGTAAELVEILKAKTND